jgi:type II secretory pathway pseudopilin PulG
MKKKHSLTIIETLIVIFLITLISGAVGYNLKGTLDKGRAFRTELAKEQLENLLLICVEEGEKPETVSRDPESYLEKYNLAKNSKKLTEDGWGVPFKIEYNKKSHQFIARSDALDAYKEKNKPR